MKNKILQRGLAMVLSAAMLLTGVQIPSMTVKAAESVVYLDDMEAAADGWTVAWGTTDAAGKVTNERKAAGNGNQGWNLWSESAQTLTLSKTLSEQSAGNYKASVMAVGGDINSGTLSIYDGETKKETATIEIGAWDGGSPDWETSTTTACAVEGTTITIKIELDFNGNGWLFLDDVKLTKEISDDTEKENKKTALKTLLDECKDLKQADYKAAGWSVLQTEITNAQAVYDAAANKTTAEIQSAIDTLQAAKDALVDASLVEGTGINVKKVNGITEDFVRGVDISTYKSLIDSGVKFKGWDGKVLDDVGFFRLLKDAGVNYVRIRVWNDPYADEAKKQGYGAGNCDVAKAAQMGKWATDAGLRVMIDFHYSDFWADPGRQVAPKAWKDYTVDQKAAAVETFTKESLETIKAAGADIGMVQVGNETNNAVCGASGFADMSKIFKAGCKAVKSVDENIQTVLHFTNPEKSDNMKNFAKQLADNGVEYDVFASSYYPYWHGTRENLTSVLKYIATTYKKKVMVAETSWASTMEDGDGQSNVVRRGQNDDTSEYPATYQGQANEVRDVIEAVANVGDAGIGVMYWEPAWLPVNVYDATADNAAETLAANKKAWDEFGSGWASSYSIAYDPNVDENNYGGSEWDNQAMFDFEGNPLPSLNVYKYVFTGSSAPKRLDAIADSSVDVKVGDDIAAALPKKVSGINNDGTKVEELDVTWNQKDIAAVEDFGTYPVRGTVSYTTEDNKTQSVGAYCVVNVFPENLLQHGDFEGDNGRDGWTIEGTGINSSETENPRSGKKCVAFYLSEAYEMTVSQTVTVAKNGIYRAFMYLQGGDAEDAVTAKIKLTNDTKNTFTEAEAKVKGWMVWQNPVTGAIEASAEDKLTVTITITGTAKSWGSIDDVYLYESAYKITYHLDNGVNAASNLKDFDGTQEIALAAPSREGYTFEGWYTDSEFNNKVDKVAAGTKGDIDLYAKWKAIQYNIAYNLNGGVNNTENPPTYTYGQAVTIKAPTRAGYTFKGWYTDSKYENAFAGITAKTTGDVTLYAKWEQNAPTSYKITYMLNGGTNDKKNPATYSTQNVTLKNPTKKNYTFGGWYTDSKFKGKKVTSTAQMSGNTTLYAKWVEVKVGKASVKSVKNNAKKKATVTIKKVTGVKGYRVQYCTSKKFNKGVKTKTTTKNSLTLSGLKKGKTYYVRVCAYKLDSKNNKVYGKYGAAKKITIKK